MAFMDMSIAQRFHILSDDGGESYKCWPGDTNVATKDEAMNQVQHSSYDATGSRNHESIGQE